MSTPQVQLHPLVVIILDGWGISFVEKGNAILRAKTPFMDSYAQHFPSAAVHAAGIEVGLPWGEIGNSETGHRNIGAGQVQYQLLPKIDNAIKDKSFFGNTAFLDAIKHVTKHSSKLHLMGLVSPGGVHSHTNHLYALLKLAATEQLADNVFIHMFTDGRDTQPQSALTYLAELEQTINKLGVGTIASVTGRFYAMDRNRNWDRTEATYNTLTGTAHQAGAPSARAAIERAYNKKIFDERIEPTLITQGGIPIATISNNDAVIFFNFRPDRARQLTQAFVVPNSVGFKPKRLKNIYFATMAQFDPDIPAPAGFAEEVGKHPLARVLSDAGFKQLHIAETEKYAHVTYYLNVGHEDPFPGEDHVLVKSTAAQDFAKEPQMKAKAITDRVVKEVKKGAYHIYFVNYANPDMVGHTGNIAAAAKACAFVDSCIGRIEQTTLPLGGALLITSDHGNVEEMKHPESGEVETDHTSNPVPLHYVVEYLRRTTPKSDQEITAIFSEPIGVLADIAPTILDILGIKKPQVMTGVSLLNSLR